MPPRLRYRPHWHPRWYWWRWGYPRVYIDYAEGDLPGDKIKLAGLFMGIAGSFAGLIILIVTQNPVISSVVAVSSIFAGIMTAIVGALYNSHILAKERKNKQQDDKKNQQLGKDINTGKGNNQNINKNINDNNNKSSNVDNIVSESSVSNQNINTNINDNQRVQTATGIDNNAPSITENNVNKNNSQSANPN